MIKVTNDYCIQPNDNCYVVMRRIEKKNLNEGDEYVSSTFHPTFTSALDKIMRTVQSKELSKYDMSLPEALKILENINLNFKGILKEYVEKHETVR